MKIKITNKESQKVEVFFLKKKQTKKELILRALAASFTRRTNTNHV